MSVVRDRYAAVRWPQKVVWGEYKYEGDLQRRSLCSITCRLTLSGAARWR